ncbi:hypothetical protein ACE1CA_13475 [Aerosakkonemataceae cyanobacterium BLCC-F167]|uniref:Uncharacterized protein n=1 Tax=Floridaenema evergladense BLCC-F167 TaxID=3153639 RepID=A0ABV4WKD9_9CYAN
MIFILSLCLCATYTLREQTIARFMLRKAQAAALLRWRGHHVPLS